MENPKASIKSAQRPNFKGDGDMPEELRSPRRSPMAQEHPQESHQGGFLEWLFDMSPIFLAGLALGMFLFYLFSPASVVEVLEEGAEVM